MTHHARISESTEYLMGDLLEQGAHLSPEVVAEYPPTRKPYSSRTLTFTLADLCANRKYYQDWPEYQRGFVWSQPDQQELINSVLWNQHIPPATVYPDSRLRQYKKVLDGQQRFSTFWRYYDNTFRTGTNQKGYTQGTERFIFPGKYYEGLKHIVIQRDHEQTVASTYFDQYEWSMIILEGITEEEIRPLFRKLQKGKPLLPAQTLWTYESQVNTVARTLLDHPIWHNGGMAPASWEMNRNDFRAALLFLFPLVTDFFANLARVGITRLASGRHDPRVGSLSEMTNRLMRRLDLVMHLLQGFRFIAPTDLFLLQQAFLLLEAAHVDLEHSRESAFLPWYHAVQEENMKHAGTDGRLYSTLYKNIRGIYHQHNFWLTQFPRLLASEGLVIKHPLKTKDASDRLLAWMQSSTGRCLKCGQTVTFSQIPYHVLRTADLKRPAVTCYVETNGNGNGNHAGNLPLVVREKPLLLLPEELR